MSGTGPPSPLPSPHRFGRYVLIDRMGKGGMAEVFRAVMPGVEGFRRDLVIKQIRPDQSRTRNFIEMFVHEARISAQLHHPNIVQVFDFGQVDGCYFLAMELLRGRDLLAVMKALRERRRPFPIPIAIHIAQQVAVGLGYAHALQTPDGRPLDILHRDVSPSNIMCLATGGVKLLDFGIASAIGEGDSDAEESTFKGKLSYLAPERLGLGANGSEPKLDGRIDLFALGTVLWEVLAGRRLFQGKTDADKLRAVLERPIPPPSSLRGDIPPRLDEIVLKALERDRDKRYLTGQALADDLEELAIDTKYQSRMLPMLLQDLFGVGGSRSHLAISALPPEFLIPPPAHASPAPSPMSTSTTAFPEPVAGETRTSETNGAAGSMGEAVPGAVAASFSAAEMSGSPTPLPPAPGLGRLSTAGPIAVTTSATEAGGAATPVLGWAVRLASVPREALRRLPGTRRQRIVAAAGGLLALVLTAMGIAGGGRSGARARGVLVAEPGGTRAVPARAPGTGSGTPITVALPPRSSHSSGSGSGSGSGSAVGSAALPTSTSASPTLPSSGGPDASNSAAGAATRAVVTAASPEGPRVREPAPSAAQIVPKAAAPTSPKVGSAARPAPSARAALARPTPRPIGKTLAAFALAPRPGSPRPGPAPPGTSAAPKGPGAPLPHATASEPSRAAGARTGTDGRVEKGLSIDPFAEAATRSTAHPRP